MISNDFFLLWRKNSTLLCNPWKVTLTILTKALMTINIKFNERAYTWDLTKTVEVHQQTRNKPAVTRWTAYSKSVVSTAAFLLRAAWRAASLQMFAMSAPRDNRNITHTCAKYQYTDSIYCEMSFSFKSLFTNLRKNSAKLHCSNITTTCFIAIYKGQPVLSPVKHGRFCRSKV